MICCYKRSFSTYSFNSLEKLHETQLPPKEAFYSKLSNSNITDDDFEHVLKVWDNLKIKTFHGYHDLYMKLDVLLLTDIFENFRSVGLKNYGLAWSTVLSLKVAKPFTSWPLPQRAVSLHRIFRKQAREVLSCSEEHVDCMLVGSTR